MIPIAPVPRSRKEWIEAADNAEWRHLAGNLKVDGDGGFTAMFITLGPKYYVRRVYQRLAKELGFVVTRVRREPPDIINPLTGEQNYCYAIRLERRQ